ncbi:MAG: hypothetical protein ACREMO_07310, partial [Gemmatimonadales bacterium]
MKAEDLPHGDSPFAESLGRLVHLLRKEPDSLAAQKSALRAAIKAIAGRPIVIEAGVENEWDDQSLKARLLARGVDVVRVMVAPPPAELLAFARALADEEVPVPSTESVAVEMFPVRPEPPEPPEPQPKPQAFVPGGGGLTVGGGGGHPTPPRVRDESMTAVVNPLLDALAGAIQRNAWSEAVQTAQTLIRT